MGKEIRYEKVEADEWALFHRVRVKFDGTWIRCNGSERECFVPWKASIKPDGKGHYEMDTVETNLVLTVFGKDNYMNYFQGALTPDKIVYIDKKQGQKLERLAERQLFGNYSSLDPNCIIHQPQCIYKLKEMEGIDRARSLTNKVLETRDSCESLANQRNVIEHDSHEERI